QLVYYYSKWANAEDFDLLLSKLREEVRTKRNQNKVPSLGIMDGTKAYFGMGGGEVHKKTRLNCRVFMFLFTFVLDDEILKKCTFHFEFWYICPDYIYG
ncbi:hypothetical protein ACILE2_11360, partial [Capnocytophaga canimorsus]